MTPNELEGKRKYFKREIRSGVARSFYPTAIESNGFTFTGAIGGVDESGKVVSRDPGEQAARAIENLKSVLVANGQALEHVVKLTIYLTKMRSAVLVEQILQSEFDNGPPACSWIEVKGLPERQQIAIEAVAIRPGEGRHVYDFMG